jgi:nicotinamide-nucleotide amidase
MDADLEQLSARVGAALKAAGWLLATAESCTGGWVSQVVTHTAGSSAWFDRGFVTYTNAAKHLQLGVTKDLLVNKGAVSEEVARAMSEGAITHSRADISLAITGIAGPTGGSPGKPVGTVCFAWCRSGQAAHSATCLFQGDRESVRRQSVVFALEQLLADLGTG